MYYVYVLFSEKLGKKYVGFSSDLKKRIEEHSNGKCAYTKKGKPWKLIYYQGFICEKDARREELFLKTGKGRNRLRYLLKETFGRFA